MYMAAEISTKNTYAVTFDAIKYGIILHVLVL